MTGPVDRDPLGAPRDGAFWIGDGPDLSPPPGPDDDRQIVWLVVALVIAALALALLTAG